MELLENTIKFLKAIESGDWFTVENLLDDDFKFQGPTPDPVNKNIWLETQKKLREAFPDWSFHVNKVEQGGSTVYINIHISGTHTSPLTLPQLGIKALPPTHIKIKLPIEKASISWKGNKIVSIKSEEVFHGGIAGILEQLGLE